MPAYSYENSFNGCKPTRPSAMIYSEYASNDNVGSQTDYQQSEIEKIKSRFSSLDSGKGMIKYENNGFIVFVSSLNGSCVIDVFSADITQHKLFLPDFRFKHHFNNDEDFNKFLDQVDDYISENW
jgi:hypothetical protein